MYRKNLDVHKGVFNKQSVIPAFMRDSAKRLIAFVLVSAIFVVI